ncbi:anthranilate phosphoribosyltransferase [Dactylosporangium sp. CA-233914]|uniref:anthranilate phosphoribosyltransferase n=1 Tax=Dactylosporangium sp. CA-233914 TaxID=3239934 RepID=UPI003D93F097
MLLHGQHLTSDDTRWVMREVMDESADPAELAGFLIALRAKGEEPAELRGLLDALMERAVRVPVDLDDITDIVGTGGDGAHTVNVSTMAAIVVAGAGARVVKHGGRSVSSKAGAADVLEALGLPLDLGVEDVARCVREVNISFTFAPRYHPGLRHANPVRRKLGVPTAINFVAPLTNPANPAAALIGCANERIARVLAQVMAERGTLAIVARGHDGLDEVTTSAPSTLWITDGGSVRCETVDPADFGIARSAPGALRGGDAAHNAMVVHRVLAGEPGAARDAVLVNAAAALAIHHLPAAGFRDAFAAGLDQARVAVDSAAAATTLERWLKLARSLNAERTG